MRPKLTKLNPKVLFSLYKEKAKCTPYLRNIFPRQITISLTHGSETRPKFFSFQTLNGEAETQFNHVLLFYEPFTEETADEDTSLADI